VKERFPLRNAADAATSPQQRKSTILRTCEVIVRPPAGVLDRGVEGLRPMMIKEVAEEIGVHPSNREPRGGQQVRAHAAGSDRTAFLLSRFERAGGSMHTPLLGASSARCAS